MKFREKFRNRKLKFRFSKESRNVSINHCAEPKTSKLSGRAEEAPGFKSQAGRAHRCDHQVVGGRNRDLFVLLAMMNEPGPSTDYLSRSRPTDCRLHDAGPPTSASPDADFSSLGSTRRSATADFNEPGPRIGEPEWRFIELEQR